MPYPATALPSSVNRRIREQIQRLHGHHLADPALEATATQLLADVEAVFDGYGVEPSILQLAGDLASIVITALDAAERQRQLRGNPDWSPPLGGHRPPVDASTWPRDALSDHIDPGTQR